MSPVRFSTWLELGVGLGLGLGLGLGQGVGLGLRVGLGMRVEGKVLHREVRAEGAVEGGELAHLQG